MAVVAARLGRTESGTIGSSQGGTVDASLVWRAESETSGSPQWGAVDASSVPTEMPESDLSAGSTFGTDQGDGGGPPAVLPGRKAHELRDWGRPPATERGGTRGQRQRLKGLPRGRGRTACGSVRVDMVWEYPEEYILDDRGRNGHDGWRTCGEQRGVERVHAEWFSG